MNKYAERLRTWRNEHPVAETALSFVPGVGTAFGVQDFIEDPSLFGAATLAYPAAGKLKKIVAHRMVDRLKEGLPRLAKKAHLTVGYPPPLNSGHRIGSAAEVWDLPKGTYTRSGDMIQPVKANPEGAEFLYTTLKTRPPGNKQIRNPGEPHIKKDQSWRKKRQMGPDGVIRESKD